MVGRNVRSFAQPHAGRQVLARLDLEDFFTSVARARVAALFRRVGYPRAVARTLAGPCTAITPCTAGRARRAQSGARVINDRPNLPRELIDNLRALLFNAVRFGPDSQNRRQHPAFRSHLEGRIAWVASINPARARPLQALFAKIPWPAEAA